jgi:hypothetical protein
MGAPRQLSKSCHSERSEESVPFLPPAGGVAAEGSDRTGDADPSTPQCFAQDDRLGGFAASLFWQNSCTAAAPHLQI